MSGAIFQATRDYIKSFDWDLRSEMRLNKFYFWDELSCLSDPFDTYEAAQVGYEMHIRSLKASCSTGACED